MDRNSRDIRWKTHTCTLGFQVINCCNLMLQKFAILYRMSYVSRIPLSCTSVFIVNDKVIESRHKVLSSSK